MENYKAGGEKGNSNLFATNRLFKKSPLFRKRKKKAPGVYDPKAKYRFDKGGEKNKCKDGEYWDGEKCTRLITYGTDQKLIDGVANWAMHSADPDKISLEYNDQIKHYLYTGKYGYDPINMSLIPLKTIDKKLISEPDKETKAIREKEKITEKKYFEEIKKDEAYNKALVDEPKYADEGLDFVKGWHDSPMYNQMVLNSFHGNQLGADYLTKLRKENIADIPPINIMATSGTSPYGFNPAATSNSRTGEVKVYPEGFGMGPAMYTHEYFHTSDKPKGIYNWDFINSEDPRFPNDKERSNERVMPESDQMYITRNRGSNWKDNQDYKSRVEKWPEAYNMPTDEEIKKILYSQDVTEDDEDFQKSFNNLKNIIQTTHKISTDTNQKEWKTFAHDYVSQPTEVRARLGEIRYQARKDGIYDPFIEQITPEIFQNYINKKRSYKNWNESMSPIQDLRKQFTDEEILWMLQNISKNDEGEEEIKVAARGGALLTKKVTCKKCGWKWDAADGGDDITTCHKCGGQGLIHAQIGGGLNKFVGGGEPCEQGFDRDPITGECISIMGQTERVQRIEEVPTNQYSKYITEYEEANPRDEFVYKKKADYLKKNKGLNRQSGLSQDNFPENAENNFNKNWEYNRNSFVIKQFAKDHGINPKNHVEIVEKMADKGNVSRDMIAHSKYGSKLQPSFWAKSLAGAQELANFMAKQAGEKGDAFNYQTPGLTKKEWENIHNSSIGALETTSLIDIPGAVIGNSIADLSTASGGNYQESPGILSGEVKSNVSPFKASLLNPINYVGLINSVSKTQALNKLLLENLLNPLNYEGKERSLPGSPNAAIDGSSQIPQNKYGGLNKYEDEGMILDLSPEEIEEYRKGGYVIEDISVPSLNHMVNGGQPCQEGYEWDEELLSCIKAFEEVKVTPESEGWFQRMVRHFGTPIVDNKIKKHNKNKEQTFDEFRRDTEFSNMYDVADWATKPEEVKPKKLKKPSKQEAAAQKLFDKADFSESTLAINKSLNAHGLTTNSFTTENGNTFPIFDSKGEYASPEAHTYMEKRQNQDYLNRQIKNNYNDGAVQMVYPEKYLMGPQGGVAGIAVRGARNLLNASSAALAPYLGYEIAGIPHLTAGNALSAYSLGKAGVNTNKYINKGEYGEAAYAAGKGLLTTLPFTKFGNPELYPVLNTIRSGLSFGTAGFDATVNPTVYNEFNLARKAPKNYIPPNQPITFSKIVGKLGKLKKQKGGAIEKNMSKLEIKKLIAQGYVVEEIHNNELSKEADGGTVSQLWQQYTGTPWSEAKKQGLTDGSFESNISLRKKILEGEFGEAKIPNRKETPNHEAYKNMVSKMISKGATLEDLVAKRIGTKEGLVNMFSELRTPVKEDLRKYAAQSKPKGIPLPKVFPKQIENSKPIVNPKIKPELPIPPANSVASWIKNSQRPGPNIFKQSIAPVVPQAKTKPKNPIVPPKVDVASFIKNLQRPAIGQKAVKVETPKDILSKFGITTFEEPKIVSPSNIKKYIDQAFTQGKTKAKENINENFEKDLFNRLTTIAQQKALLKPEPINKVEPIPNSMAAQFSKQDFNKKSYDANGKEIKNITPKMSDFQTEYPFKETIEDTGKFIKDTKESIGEYIEYVSQGIRRKSKTYGLIDDDDIKVPELKESDNPLGINEYYRNLNSTQQSFTIPNSNRNYKQQVLPISNIKLGYRNRGDYNDIESEGLELTTFHPFTNSDKLKNITDNTSVFALDADGNLHTGQFKDFKNNKDWKFSQTYMNKIIDIEDLYIDGSKSGNPGYKQPKVKVLENGKIKDGSLNILTKGKDKDDYYGSIQGGRILFVNPVTKEQYLVSGSLSTIKKEFKKLKGTNQYLEAWTLDNGTYSRGLSYDDKKLTADRLKAYDNENSSGGNGLYIINYKTPVNEYEEEYVLDMPNLRTKNDASYKKGHKLKNEVKNIVLHHTAYEDTENNYSQVRNQYMTPGKSSSHVVIEEDGKRTVYASPEQVTFHAGESEWNGRKDVNDFSIGVEFQGNTVNTPLTDAQIKSFIEYYRPIATKYNLSLKDVISHQMISPDRKPDVTAKEYQRILKYMKEKGFK